MEGPALKKRKLEEPEANAFSRIVGSEFDAIQLAMHAFDDNRENVIKKTRDIQKLSKQAIYSLVYSFETRDALTT